MKSKKMLLLSGFLILVMILSSCADDQDELPPVAVVRARELLADTLGVDIARVTRPDGEEEERGGWAGRRRVVCRLSSRAGRWNFR